MMFLQMKKKNKKNIKKYYKQKAKEEKSIFKILLN